MIMTTKTTYEVTAPDGTILTRTSTHAYTFAMVAVCWSGAYGASFHSSEALARAKAAKHFKHKPTDPDPVVLPARARE
jgi:hypothetical protein